MRDTTPDQSTLNKLRDKHDEISDWVTMVLQAYALSEGPTDRCYCIRPNALRWVRSILLAARPRTRLCGAACLAQQQVEQEIMRYNADANAL